MPLPRLATVIGAAMLTPAGRRFAARHGGKIAAATTAFELWRMWRAHRTGQPQAAQGVKGGAARPASRRRWSHRKP